MFFYTRKVGEKPCVVILLRAAQFPVRKGDIYNQPYEEKEIKEKKNRQKMVEEENNIFSPPFYLQGQTQGTWDCALNVFNGQAALTG